MQMPIHFSFQFPTAKDERTSKTHSEQEPRVAINVQKHRPEDGWTAAGSCLTVETYRMFELWVRLVATFSILHYSSFFL